MTDQDRRVAIVASALALAVASFIACSGGAPNDVSAPASTSPVASASPGDSPDAAAEPPPPPAKAGKRPMPTSAMDCTNIATDITNDPPLDGGVAMNNATTAGDAGGSDRLVSTMEVIQKHRDAYRCCFDLWGKDHVGEEAKIALVLELDPAGKLTKASFKEAETDLKDEAVARCMSDVAQKQTFPASPSGKETTYTHRFVFKARAR